MQGHGPVRTRQLPSGWYPDDPDEIRSLAAAWTSHVPSLSAMAAIGPHAGWYFSGNLAAKAVWALGDCDTVAVLGGHLRYGDPILFADEVQFDCAVRMVDNDFGMLDALKSELADVGIKEIVRERSVDNSVEVMLPLVATRFPEARILWLRIPPDYKAKEVGSALMRAATVCNRKLAVLGSTDLTHYGPNYGFMPKGIGDAAADWVRNENDRGFISAVLSMDPDKALVHARERYSACSAGAAAATIAFALDSGARRSVLIGHTLSWDVHKDRSFVGYAAIAFVP